MRRRLTASLLAVAIATAPAAADPVQDRVDRAMAYYEAADLGRALDELQAAYALAPRPDIAFAMGKIHVERGECAEAIIAYRRFLESKPGPSSTQIATDAIAQCQKLLLATGEALPEPEREPAPVPAPTPAPLPAPDSAPVSTTRTRPWYSDTLGDALVVAGTGGLILGGVLALSARTDVDRANQGAAGGVTLVEYQRLSDAADRKQLFAAISAGAGAALIVGGIVRYATGDRTETIVVEPAGDGGATVHARWRF